jgi:hypothetical protein
VVYNGATDEVTKFIDPVGKSITLGYVSGKLATFTDPGLRESKVTINATTNQLTEDSLSSPQGRGNRTVFVYQTYPGTKTVLLFQRVGVITDTTRVTYDSTFTRRPVQVRLPQVKDEAYQSDPFLRHQGRLRALRPRRAGAERASSAADVTCGRRSGTKGLAWPAPPA